MTKEVNITCCGAVSAETCTNATFGAVTTFLPLVNGGAAIRVFTQEDMLLVGHGGGGGGGGGGGNLFWENFWVFF